METMMLAKMLMTVENVKILIVWISAMMATKDGLVMAIVTMVHGDYILTAMNLTVIMATA